MKFTWGKLMIIVQVTGRWSAHGMRVASVLAVGFHFGTRFWQRFFEIPGTRAMWAKRPPLGVWE